MIKKYPNPYPNGKPFVDCLGCGKRKEHHAKDTVMRVTKELFGIEKKCPNCYRMFILTNILKIFKQFWGIKDMTLQTLALQKVKKAFEAL